MSGPVVILGAGIAGISASYHLAQAGVQATAYEAASSAGGLLDNFSIDGFRFDNAVHLSFTRSDYVRSLFDQTPYLAHHPAAWCWEAGRWLRHPVQNNLHPLPADERLQLLEGFLDRPELDPDNYGDWLRHQYGDAIVDRYPRRYTEKYWTVAPEQLGLDWIGNRMRRADRAEILRGALGPQEENHYYAAEMRYPREGGYRAFIEPLIAGADIACNQRAVAIDPAARRVDFADGSSQHYERLISSLPLPVMAELIGAMPAAVREAADGLWATSVDLVSLGFSRPDVAPHLWFYLYDDDLLPARGYSPSLKSPANAPAGCSSLQFEIYHSRHRPLGIDGPGLEAHCRELVQRLGLCGSEDILFSHHKRLPWGNVVFDLGAESRRATVLDWLRNQQIDPVGRFGEWDYFWSDQSLLSGKAAAERWLEQAA